MFGKHKHNWIYRGKSVTEEYDAATGSNKWFTRLLYGCSSCPNTKVSVNYGKFEELVNEDLML